MAYPKVKVEFVFMQVPVLIKQPHNFKDSFWSSFYY